MKSLMLFLQVLLEDLGEWCGTSTTRDFETVSRRVKHEGLSFLTITLPDFGKDFERSLDLGRVTHDLFTGFRFTGGLPSFLRGFLGLVFDSKSGYLLDNPSTVAIFAVRQISLLYGKILLPCSESRISKAMDGFIECERNIHTIDALLQDIDGRSISPLPDSLLDQFERIGSLLWRDIFTEVDREVYNGDIVPGHGPGQTAEKLSANAKWNQSEWTDRLEDSGFSYLEFLSSSFSLGLSRLQKVVFREPDTERPVRVVPVPKTLKTPRIIAIEPACMTYVQQGLMVSIKNQLEVDPFGQFVDYSSQVPNQRLALYGSSSGDLATLDLSEASDRVSNLHVRTLLKRWPHLASAVDACRSRKADVPGHGIISLSKFASMGSSLCFPMESLVFCTLVFCGIERERGTRLTRRSIKEFAGSVRVYGDDIIVPVDYVHSVVRALEAFGFVVNGRKSFWTGKFRESCGKEYYDGCDVSITRIRNLFPTSRRCSAEILSTIASRNLFYKAGLWKCARFLDDILEGLIPFPAVEETSPIQGKFSFVGPSESTRLDPNYHTPLVKGIVVRAVVPSDPLDDYGALMKCLLSLEKRDRTALPSGSERHLLNAGRPRTVHIKTRWGPVA